MRDLWSDVEFSFRGLKRAAGFASVAVATLALAIGVNTAIFSAVEGMILRPLPYGDPSRLVFLSEDSKAFPGMSINPVDLKDWQEQNDVFEGLAGYRAERFVYSGSGSAQLVRGAEVNASLFGILGVAASIGRTIVPEDDRPGAPAVVVVGEGFARQHLGSVQEALGKSITLDGE